MKPHANIIELRMRNRIRPIYLTKQFTFLRCCYPRLLLVHHHRQ